jgi:assimilatory nitrate reductase electron transfer subunit
VTGQRAAVPTRDRRGPRRVVVVGYGMVGARFAEEVRRRDPEGERVRLTVLGAEPEGAYNRVLLSGVLAGRLAEDSIRGPSASWAHGNDVDLRLGTRAVAVRAADRTVRLATRHCHGEPATVRYDALVMATGNQARLPAVPGLTVDGRPAPGVVAFRNLEDCRRILDLAAAGSPLAVLGGGVLGLEAARALALRGVKVTVVHPSDRLMPRQLDTAATRVLCRRLAELGVEVRLGTSATGWHPGQGLELRTGTGAPAWLDCAGVVVTAGVLADTGVARRAGVALARDGGIPVDDRLRTSVPGIYSVGDCARFPGTVDGLVQPGWEQAAVLADVLCGTDPDARYRGTPSLTQLKAPGVDLTTFGTAPGADQDDDPDTEVVSVNDPRGGRYGRLVLREERIVGGIMLGLPDAAALATSLYDRAAPAPSDRLALLLGRAMPSAAEPAATPALMPDRTVVCRCNTVTKGALTAAWLGGARTLGELACATRATTGCGSCLDTVGGIAEWLERSDPPARTGTTEGAA